MSREYLQYRAVDFLSTLLPRRIAYRVGTWVADGRFRRDDRGRRAVVANLRHIHAWSGQQPSEEELADEARRMFHNFGKYLVDFFRFTRLSREMVDRLIRIDHVEHIRDAASMNRGVLAVTAHVGSWEIGGAVLSSFGFPMNVVVLPMRDKMTNRLFQSRREARGLRVIPVGHAVRGIYEAIRRKEFVALLGDRDYSTNEHTVEFFGAPARLPIGPAKLCFRTGAPVLPGFLIRQPDDTFLMKIHAPILPESGTTQEALQQRISRVLEQEVAQHPDQWFLFEEFWAASPRPA